MRFQPWRIFSGGLKMPTPLHQRIFYTNSKGLNGFCQETAVFLSKVAALQSKLIHTGVLFVQ
jgi:hypothetical protein